MPSDGENNLWNREIDTHTQDDWIKILYELLGSRRKRKTQKYQSPAWSIALAKARMKVVVLTKCLSMARTGYNFATEICKHLSDGTFLDNLIPRKSFSRREEEQQAKIEALEASDRNSDKQQAIIIRRIKRAEASKKLQEAVNRALTTTLRQGVSRLEIPMHTADDPKNCTDWRVIDIPSAIIHNLQIRNQRHFGQALVTPFTIHPLFTAFQFMGEGIATNKVLSGVFDPPNIDEDVELLIRHLKISAKTEQIRCTATISDEDLQGNKLKVWKESTTTSPSGVHLCHYKALIARHQYSHVQDEDSAMSQSEATQTELRNELNHMQQSIRELHLQLINYALERGYSYKRWQKKANTILFKEQNNIKIHRTRVIHLYKADYNLVLGLKWRAALYQAETSKILHDGQFGSRPRRNAVEPVMLEKLQLKVSRATRKMFLQLNYNATACHDRILLNLAMVVSQQHGVHKQVTLANARMLQHAAYHI